MSVPIFELDNKKGVFIVRFQQKGHIEVIFLSSKATLALLELVTEHAYIQIRIF